MSPQMSNLSTGLREPMKKCQCFPEPLKHNREAVDSYVGNQEAVQDLYTLILLGADPDLTMSLMVKKPLIT